MKHPRWFCAVVAALALFSLDGRAQAAASAKDKPAEAQPAAPSADPSPEVMKEAGQRYERGLELYSEGDYGLAVIEFERAYELVPNYRVLYNIGQVRVQLGRYAKARKALEEYLAKGGDEIKPERRASVKNDLEMLAGRTAMLTVVTNEPGAEIVIDSLVVGTSPLAEALLVDAGEHTVEVRKPGYYGKGSQVKLAGREELTVTLDITKVPEAKTGPSIVRVEQAPVMQKPDRTAMYIGWAATGTLAIGAGVFGYMGITKANDLESLRTDYGVTREKLDDTSSSARTLFMIGDIMGGAAVLAGGVSLYLTLSGGTSKPVPSDQKPVQPAPKVGLGVLPNYVSVHGRF